MRPKIGLTALRSEGDESFYHILADPYAEAILLVGGLPLLLPVWEGINEESLQILDGLLLVGGGDINPAHFGEEVRFPLNLSHPLRDNFELALVRKAFELDLPILGICRGHQVLNVALGGSLYQDIPSEIPEALDHSQKEKAGEVVHKIQIEEGSCLEKVFGRELGVNSTHHQAVKDVGEGLEVTARAFDGIIEGIEGKGNGFVVGVQWHPERLLHQFPVQKKLFETFVDACRAKRE